MFKHLLSISVMIAAVGSIPAHALLTDAAPDPTWANVVWVPYVVEGDIARDPEGGSSQDLSNGGASFSGAAEIASGFPQNDDPSATPCWPTGGGNDCGLYPSAYYYYYDGGTPGFAGTDNDSNGVDDAVQDDILYLRVRVDGDPENATGEGLVQNHWNFLVDIEESTTPGTNACGSIGANPDCYKEIWIDLDGNGFKGGDAEDKLRIVYENNQSNLVSNDVGAGDNTDSCAGNSTTNGTGVVVNAFMACHTQNIGDCAGNRSHTRVVTTSSQNVSDINGANSGAGDTTGEYFVDVQVPVSALRRNDGCYSNPEKLADTETYEPGTHLFFKADQDFRLFYSTSNSATDPLQKDYIAPGDFSDPASTPVTIAYLNAKPQGDGLKINWSTATETSNVGFNFYGIINGEWIKLNEQMIPGSLDSLEPKSYQTKVSNPYGTALTQLGIAGVDPQGSEDRHGPFELDTTFGEQPIAQKVHWQPIKASVDATLKSRKIRKGQSAHLSVAKDGLYRLTDAQLDAIGYNLDGLKPGQIALSFRGEAVPRAIGGLDNKGRWGSSSWMEFIGKAPTGRDAVYLNEYKYQISRDTKLVSDAGLITPPEEKTALVENNNTYAFTTPGDDPWYDAAFYALGAARPGSLSRTFNLPGLQDENAELELHLAALSEGDHHLRVSLNGVQVADVTTKGWTNWPISIPVGSGILRESGNTLTLALPGDVSPFDYVLFDKLIVRYQDNLGVEKLTPQASLAHDIKASELTTGQADLLVISHPTLMGEVLNSYVAERESQGWRVKVVDVLDIYEAFGFGMALPDAIEGYLRDARKTGYTHVQLVGAANYDYRDYLQQGSVSFIPSLYTFTSEIINYTPCDACYVLDDQKSLPLAAIGRWPVRSEAELATMIDKGKNWTTNTSSIRQSLLIADESQPGYDFIGQLEQVASTLAATGQWEEPTRVYYDEALAVAGGNASLAINNIRASIKSELEAGASITLYSGHGAPSVWSYKGMLRQQDVAGLNNSFYPTLALPFTCYTTYADSPTTDTLAHQLTAADPDGAVAVYGAATLSAFGDNQIAISALLDELLTGKTLGEAVRDSKIGLGNSGNFRDVIMNSNLLGDATLKLE